MQFDHIAIKTNDLDKSLKFYNELWFEVEKVLEKRPEQEVYQLRRDNFILELIYSFVFDGEKDKYSLWYGHIWFKILEENIAWIKKNFLDVETYEYDNLKVFQIKWPSWEEVHFNYYL